MKENEVQCLNGSLQPGDMVISIPEDDFACLVGEVAEITLVGTPEHSAESGNETDNVHVDFTIFDYSDERENEIAAMFTQLYGVQKEFADCPLDGVIMCPDSLIRISGIGRNELDSLLDNEADAVDFCNRIVQQKEIREQLFERLDENWADFQSHLRSDDFMARWQGMNDKERSQESKRISDTGQVYDKLKEAYVFDDSEIKYLCQFQNPLEIVADALPLNANFSESFEYAMWSVVDNPKHLSEYPLADDQKKPNGPLHEKAAGISGKPSVREQLKQAEKEVVARPPTLHDSRANRENSR